MFTDLIQKYSNDIPEYVKTNLIRWVELLREYTGRGVKEDDFDIIPFIPSIPTFTANPTSNSSSKQFNSKSSSSSRLHHDFLTKSTSPTNITDLFNFKLDQTLPQLKSSLEEKNIPLQISNVKNENEVIKFCDPIFKCFETHLPTQQNIGIYVEGHVPEFSKPPLKSRRKADICLYSKQQSSLHKFDCIQWNTIIPIELKKSITTSGNKNKLSKTKINEAIHQLQRDFSFSKNYQANYGITGDGMNWIFTKTHYSCTPEESFITDYSDLYETKCAESWCNFFNIIYSILTHRKIISPSIDNFKSFGLNFSNYMFVNTKTVVIRFIDSKNKPLIGRFSLLGPINYQPFVKLILKKEFRDCDSIIPVIDDKKYLLMIENGYFLMKDIGGISLEKYCLCTQLECNRIKDIVKRDITKALNFLHDKGLAFVDVHPGNIIIAKGKAYLIDLDSIRYLNHKLGYPREDCEDCEEKACCFHQSALVRNGYGTHQKFYTKESDFKSLEIVLEKIDEKCLSAEPPFLTSH